MKLEDFPQVTKVLDDGNISCEYLDIVIPETYNLELAEAADEFMNVLCDADLLRTIEAGEKVQDAYDELVDLCETDENEDVVRQLVTDLASKGGYAKYFYETFINQ